MVLNKYVNIHYVINIKWLPIEKRIEYSPAIMGVKEIYDEDVPNYLKLTQKVASTSNLRINDTGIIIYTNQQWKTFEKQNEDIFNKRPTNI